jgi:cysteine desulfurase
MENGEWVMKQIYLDYAAATPVDERVLEAMRPYFADNFYNPSANYLEAKRIREQIDISRKRIAAILGVRTAEVIFTAGGTEANNIAIHGVMGRFPGGHLIISAIEHESVRLPANQYDHTELPVGSAGIIDLEKLKQSITPKTVLVSIMYASNEIGTIQPLAMVAKVIKEVRHERMLSGNTTPLYFHTDACQAANYLHILANTLGVDMMTINSGKIYGPKQTGALYIKTGINIQPQIQGGGQERGFRSGTENVAGIIGFASALTIAYEMREAETKRVSALQKLFIKEISGAIPSAILNGSKDRLANNVHITIPGTDNERLIFALDEQGIQCAAGSACSASKVEPSHTLKAIGLTDAEAQSSLRFTMGRFNDETDIIKTIDVLAKLVS